jgi:hypothetical protein
MVRFVNGPMSASVCFFKTVVRGSCLMQGFLFYNCIALMRLVQRFVLTSVINKETGTYASFDFVNIWAKSIAIILP